jgi:hypothetical protein
MSHGRNISMKTVILLTNLWTNAATLGLIGQGVNALEEALHHAWMDYLQEATNSSFQHEKNVHYLDEGPVARPKF